MPDEYNYIQVTPYLKGYGNPIGTCSYWPKMDEAMEQVFFDLNCDNVTHVYLTDKKGRDFKFVRPYGE